MRQVILPLVLAGLMALTAFPALAQDADEELSPPPADTQEEAPTPGPPPSSAAYRASSGDVRPFQSWIEDATIVRGMAIEPVFELYDVGGGTLWRLGAQAAFEAAEHFEAGVRWTLDNLDYDSGDSETGMDDIRGYARYLIRRENPQVAGGLWVDLPVGSSSVGANNFNVDVFGALRWMLGGGWVILGNAGIESVEFGSSRETGVHLGAAALYPLSQDLSTLAEIDWSSASNYGVLSLGFDFRVTTSNHVRVAVGTGFDDNGPDLQLLLGFLMGFD